MNLLREWLVFLNTREYTQYDEIAEVSLMSVYYWMGLVSITQRQNKELVAFLSERIK